MFLFGEYLLSLHNPGMERFYKMPADIIGHDKIKFAASREASNSLRNYPSGVARSIQELDDLAESGFMSWKDMIVRTDYRLNQFAPKMYQWRPDETTYWMFIHEFVKEYKKFLANRDQKRDESLLAAASPPAELISPPNVATLQGANITLKSVEEGKDGYTYTIELADPNRLTEPETIRVHKNKDD